MKKNLVWQFMDESSIKYLWIRKWGGWFQPKCDSAPIYNDCTKLLFEVAQHFILEAKWFSFVTNIFTSGASASLWCLPHQFFLLNSQSKQEQAGLGVGCCSSEKLFELFELAKSRRIKQQCNLRGWYDSSKHGIVVHRCM